MIGAPRIAGQHRQAVSETVGAHAGVQDDPGSADGRRVANTGNLGNRVPSHPMGRHACVRSDGAVAGLRNHISIFII